MKWLTAEISDYGEEDYAKAYSLLSESRRARINSKKNEADKKRSLLCDLLAERLLSELGQDFQPIENDEKGRPYLKASPLLISLSHSADMAAVIISERPVGIDIEKKRKINRRVEKRVCTDKERIFIGQSKDKTEAFLEVWTAKEAYFKMQERDMKSFKDIDIFKLNREVYKNGEYIIQIIF